MEGRLIDVGDPLWRQLLADVRHDVYHRPGYASVSAWQEGGQAQAVCVNDDSGRLLIPLVIREIEGGERDAVSPYGYPGVLTDHPDDAGFVAAAMGSAIEALREAGIVSLFVRLHPLLPVRGLESVAAMTRHQTVAIDLSLPPERLWSDTRENHRRDINKALRRGHAFAFEHSDEALAAFRGVYRDTMDRLGASEYYRFDDEYFDRLLATLGLGDAIHLATVRIEGEVAAAGLFTESGGIVQLHLSGTDERHSQARPTKLLYHGVRGWARDRGDRWFHLGGGRGSAEDSLFHFKAGFSPHRASFVTLRAVVREEAYRALVASNSPDADPDDHLGYFPAYRRPVMSVDEDAPGSVDGGATGGEAGVPS